MKIFYEFFRILNTFRGKFCHSLAAVAADINVKTLKENGIPLYSLLRML